jgi:hypothetical protein
VKEYTPAYTKAIKRKRERDWRNSVQSAFFEWAPKEKRASLIPLTMFVMADVLAQSVKV